MTAAFVRLWQTTTVAARVTIMALASASLILPGVRAADLGAGAPRPAARQIAFSFDDAPRGPGAFLDPNDRAGRLLTVLQDHGVEQVAFYVNPSRIHAGDGHAARLDAYVAAGHVIADHSWSHPRLSGVTADRYLADIDRAEAWLRGRPGYRPWFRFPFLDEGGRDLARRDAVRVGLAERGLRDAYVTTDGSDWGMEAQTIRAKRSGQAMDMAALRDLYVETHVQSAEFSDSLLRRTLGRAPPQVMLLHETDLAALFLGDLIAALRRRGFVIVTADAAYADPIYRSAPDTRFANGTLPEMLAWEKGVGGPRWYARNDLKLADRLFRERVLHEK